MVDVCLLMSTALSLATMVGAGVVVMVFSHMRGDVSTLILIV